MRSSESLARPDGIQHSLEQVNSSTAPMIEVIVKVAERCNLVCSYCYYFFAGDLTYKTRPGRMSRQVIDGLAKFLAEGATTTGIPSIKLVFHGGEPLLLRKADFEYACEAFRREVSPVTRLSLTVQTNGVLIDDEWVEIFRRHGVSVGISLDGNQDVNDRYRVDRLGRGTHSRVVEGFRQFRQRHGRNSGSSRAC